MAVAAARKRAFATASLPQSARTPRGRWLTDAEIARLPATETAPHSRPAVVPMPGSAARVGAILDVTSGRIDLDAGRINLCLPESGTRKGCAVVPLDGMARAAPEAARPVAVTAHVIAWGGRPIARRERVSGRLRPGRAGRRCPPRPCATRPPWLRPASARVDKLGPRGENAR